MKRTQTIPHTVLGRRTLCFSLYRNHEFKMKMYQAEARERKRKCVFFQRFFVALKFYLYVQSIEQTSGLYILLYIKKTTSYVFWLFSKSSKAFNTSLLYVSSAFLAAIKIANCCGFTVIERRSVMFIPELQKQSLFCKKGALKNFKTCRICSE